jgi:protein tyrosine/serine phosphatase
VSWIRLEGACNARDLGGLPTIDGRTTRRGVLLRADNLQDLTPADLTALQHVGAVIDLRTSAEVEITGPGPLREAGVTHHHIDLIPHGFDGRSDLVERTIPDESAGEHAMDHFYIDYVRDAPHAIADALRTIAQSREAVLVHCAAGKDRTGVLVAIALSLVGVTRDAVVADYARSAERIEQIRDRLLSNDLYATDIARRSLDSMVPHAGNMERFLDRVDREYGGMHGLAMAIGFDEESVARLSRRLVDSLSG